MNILICDDEELMLDLLKQEILEAGLGVCVDTCRDLTSLERCYSEKNYNLIICDYHIPGSPQGEVKEILAKADIPVFVISADPERRDFSDNVHRFFFKPFEVERFIAELAEFLSLEPKKEAF